jgi:GT2 family glycosyltransferase
MSVDLSVVTATCRRPEFVVEAVRSALAQTGPSLEVLVLDDDPAGSARGPIEALAKEDPRVRYLAASPASNGAPALVYNQGAAQARGRAIVFLDDDDLALPGAFAKLLAALDEKPARAFAFGLVEPFGGTPEVMIHETAFFVDATARARAAARSGTRFLVAHLTYGASLFVVSGAIFRRDALLAAGGFDPAVRINTALDLAARLAHEHTWALVDEPVVLYRVHAASLMHDLKNRPALESSYQVMGRKVRARLGLLGWLRFRHYAKRLLSTAAG